MHFSYFRTLALPWQAHIICECGTQLSGREKDNVFIELYQIDSFYAEVHYRQKDNEIIKITSFQDVHYLKSYLNRISTQNTPCRIENNFNYEK